VRQRLEFWADLNRDVFQFVLDSSMKAHQYIAVRVEDLVVGNEPCFRRLAAFLGLTDKETSERVPLAIEKNRGHKSSYFGHHCTCLRGFAIFDFIYKASTDKGGAGTPEIRSEVERKAQLDEDAASALKFWGYSTEEYALRQPCEELEWMDAIRRRKGPLPGDKP